MLRSPLIVKIKGELLFIVLFDNDYTVDQVMRAWNLLFVIAFLAFWNDQMAWAAEKAAKRRAIASEYFTDGDIPYIKIEVADAEMDSLRNTPRKYVTSTIREGDTVYTNVMIHLKGSVGSFRNVDDKPGLTLNLKSTGLDNGFHGLRKFHLNNGMQDRSYLNEWFCSEIFRAAKVPAPRSTHALVDLNGRKLGLYVLVEAIEKDFLSGYFTNTAGNVYGQSGPGDVTEPLERMEGEGENTRADLKALAATVREKDLMLLREKLPKVLDIERFISFMALEVMLCHWDGYTFAAHNFRIYQDLDTDRMVFIPHDMDQMLGDPTLPIQPAARGMVAQDILKMKDTRALYHERLAILLNDLFITEKLTNRVDQRVKTMLPVLARYDPNIARDVENNADLLKDRIKNRVRNLKEQISRPLPPNWVVEGVVRDTDTQKPIPSFLIIPGHPEGQNGVQWDRMHVYRALNGKFSMDLAQARLPKIPSYLKLEATGHLPTIVKYAPAANTENTSLQIDLKKSDRLRGVVLLADGTAARGAQVDLVTESYSPILGQGNFVMKPGALTTRAVDRGRYSFSSDPEALTVIAAHETGYAEMPVDEISTNLTMTLQPWGQINAEIQGSAGALPSTIAVVTSELLIPNLFQGIYSGMMNLDFTRFTQEAAPNSSIVFEKTPPGTRYLWRALPINSPTNTSLPNLSFVGRRLQIKPGETNHITWKGNERLLKGRIKLSGSHNALQENNENPNAGKIPIKLGHIKLTHTSANTVDELFFTTGENDSFCVNGPEPGNYHAEFRIYFPPQLLGRTQKEITIAPGTAPVDIGAIDLPMIKSASVGEKAPLFETKTVDGQPLKMSAFRGKYVLLYFWATWCNPQLNVVPNLKAVWEECHDNPRFAMVGLSLDPNAEIARRYATRNALQWPQAYLGEWFQTSLPSEFGVRGIPSAVLVDPDGKILAKDMAFDGINAILKELIQKTN